MNTVKHDGVALDLDRRIDLASILEERAAERPDKVLFDFPREGHQLTYGAFDELVNRLANGLRGLGVGKGDYVAVMLRSGSGYLATSYALKKLGAVEVAINPEFRDVGLSRIINLAAASVLVCSREMLEPLAAIAGDLPAIRRAIIVDGERDDVEAALPRVGGLAFGEVLSDDASRPSRDVRDTDVQAIIFTSGTTGLSKGCMVSHRYAVRMAQSFIPPLRITEHDRAYTPYPLSHVHAAYCEVLPLLIAGGSVAVVAGFSASRFWDEVRETDATIFAILGTIGKILFANDVSPGERDHRVERAWGGPLPPDVKGLEERFGLELLRGGGYGSTDAGAVAFAGYGKDVPLTCAGKVFPWFDVRIADDDGYALPRGEVGEILVRPREPDIMSKGYFGMPEATLEARRDLWFHSGDLGWFDDDDNLHFRGRKQERIRRGGENVSAYEVEEILETHPAVVESAVLPVPSPMGEDDIYAFVRLREGADVDADGMREYCRSKMAKYMVPSRFHFVPELPKTHTGKVLLQELHRRYVAAGSDDSRAL